jgi:nitric oxide reductase subunit B
VNCYILFEDAWSDRLARTSFRSLNIGLTWMCFVTLLPLGIIQLHRSVSEDYWAARELNFLTSDLNVLLGWLRLPGDLVFIGGGVLPLVWMGWQGVRYRGSHQDALDHEDLLLFTEASPSTGTPDSERVEVR